MQTNTYFNCTSVETKDGEDRDDIRSVAVCEVSRIAEPLPINLNITPPPTN
jgi:hypothetical protein